MKPFPISAEEIKKASEDRDATAALLRKILKYRSGKSWSVTVGRGSVYGWVDINSPPKRQVDGANPQADIDELSKLFDTHVHHQGIAIPAARDYRVEFLERAAGLPVTKPAVPYWD